MQAHTSTYQTVIYDKDSGDILHVLANQYISSKQHLANLAGRPKWHGLAFIYFPFDLDVDPSKHKIHRPGPHSPAYVADTAGYDIATQLLYHAAKKLLSETDKIVYIFEGGLGDYINQGNVMSHIRSKYPTKTIYASCKPDRFALLSFLPGWGQITPITKNKAQSLGVPIIDFAQISRIDYNYPPYGKRGVYAGLAGVEPNLPFFRLKPPPESLSWAKKQWKAVSTKKTKLKISLHTRSGEPNSKTWPWEHTLDLIKNLRLQYSPSFALFGGHGQGSLQDEDIIDAVGHFDWIQVASLIAGSDLVICIDSAIMHIAHHLKVPTLSLWGPTAASHILSEKHGTSVIESAVPCHPCGSFSCKKGECMQSITPAMVAKQAALIIKSLKSA